jgi:hypothetical protein
LVDASVPVPWLPFAASVPAHPPDAVQEVALVALHVSVELPPLAIAVGFAVSVTVGVPGTVTIAVAALLVPPGPTHVKE